MSTKMKRLIQWIQIPDMSPLPVMDRVFEEATAAFIDDGCRVKRVTTWNMLEDDGIIFMDDGAGTYLHHSEHHQRLAKQCPSSIFVCWYWTDSTYRPFSRMIVTGEHYIYRHQASPEKQAFMLRPDFVPLFLRANESPLRIGTYLRRVERDYCFMGGGYRMDWIPPADKFTGLYHRVLHTNYLSYEERRTIYLSSFFALAFQSDENIQTGHLSQRIFEGLAYGCIVFCENPLASLYTRGAVIHVTSREDLWKKMQEWKQASATQIQEQQEKGYEWSRLYGTNRTSMALLWQRIQSRFHVMWNVSSTVVSVNIMGGLGNQLFQLACGYSYAQMNGAQFKIEKRDTNGNRELYWDSLLTLWRHYLTTESLSLPRHGEYLATVYSELPAIPDNGLYLEGYRQSSRYMLTAWNKDRIRQLFRAPSEIEHAIYHSYPYLIRNRHRVIVLHSRQTDYVERAGIHGPLTMEYYKNAVERMLEQKQEQEPISDPIYVLCGDDPQFWSTLEKDLPQVYASPHVLLQNETDVRTFVLLQQFQHFIMSNSTFIWWAVWMASAKRVIVPDKWFGPHGPSHWEDIYEPSWERLAV